MLVIFFSHGRKPEKVFAHRQGMNKRHVRPGLNPSSGVRPGHTLPSCACIAENMPREKMLAGLSCTTEPFFGIKKAGSRATYLPPRDNIALLPAIPVKPQTACVCHWLLGNIPVRGPKNKQHFNMLNRQTLQVLFFIPPVAPVAGPCGRARVTGPPCSMPGRWRHRCSTEALLAHVFAVWPLPGRSMFSGISSSSSSSEVSRPRSRTTSTTDRPDSRASRAMEAEVS